MAEPAGQQAGQAGTRPSMVNAGVKEGEVGQRRGSVRGGLRCGSILCQAYALPCTVLPQPSRSTHSLGWCLLPPETQLEELSHSLPLYVASRAPGGWQPAENCARYHVVACRTPPSLGKTEPDLTYYEYQQYNKQHIINRN